MAGDRLGVWLDESSPTRRGGGGLSDAEARPPPPHPCGSALGPRLLAMPRRLPCEVPRARARLGYVCRASSVMGKTCTQYQNEISVCHLPERAARPSRSASCHGFGVVDFRSRPGSGCRARRTALLVGLVFHAGVAWRDDASAARVRERGRTLLYSGCVDALDLSAWGPWGDAVRGLAASASIGSSGHPPWLDEASGRLMCLFVSLILSGGSHHVWPSMHGYAAVGRAGLANCGRRCRSRSASTQGELAMRSLRASVGPARMR